MFPVPKEAHTCWVASCTPWPRGRLSLRDCSSMLVPDLGPENIPLSAVPPVPPWPAVRQRMSGSCNLDADAGARCLLQRFHTGCHICLQDAVHNRPAMAQSSHISQFGA